jgi:hypothetical protein
LQSFHCCNQVIGSIELKDPPTNARIQTVPDHLLGVHVGKDQYFLGRIHFQDLPCGIDTVELWHANVQNEKIWFQLLALLYRIPPVGYLSADLPFCVSPKQRAHAEPEYWMIVSHQNTKRTHRPSSQ